MTDDHFPDVMREVGVDDPATVQAYLTAVETLAVGASRPQSARLVHIAHGNRPQRDSDEWFWRPFREANPAFLVDDAVPLHSRLADACVRGRLAAGSRLDAMMVRLAANDSWVPATDLLRPAGQAVLSAAAAQAQPPPPSVARKLWGPSQQEKLAALTTIDPQALTVLAETLTSATEQALGAMRSTVNATIQWATTIQNRLRRDQSITEWLIAGVRADGVRWDELEAVTVAVDAGAELANRLDRSPPEAWHEQLLTLVLRAAAGEAASRGVSASESTSATRAPIDPVLAPFTPLHRRLTEGGDMSTIPAETVAVRFLWEAATVAAWAASG